MSHSSVAIATLTNDNDVIICIPSDSVDNEEERGGREKVTSSTPNLPGFVTYCLPKESDIEGSGPLHGGMCMCLKIFSIPQNTTKSEVKEENIEEKIRREREKEKDPELQVPNEEDASDRERGERPCDPLEMQTERVTAHTPEREVERWVIACGYENGEVWYCDIRTMRCAIVVFFICAFELTSTQVDWLQ
jgi:hypothetical protein